MKHFTTEEWVDFVRGTSAPELRKAMRRHLENCRKCPRTLRWWQTLAHILSRDALYRPPKAAVESVEKLYARRLPLDTQPSGAKIARLVRDSFQHPQPAGVRSFGPAPRQVLYQAGTHFIDLRLEPMAASGSFSLVGQVLDSSEPKRIVDNIPVLLVRGKDTVAQGNTNELGEFQFELEAGKNYHIRIVVDEEKPIVLRSIASSPGPQWDSGKSQSS